MAIRKQWVIVALIAFGICGISAADALKAVRQAKYEIAETKPFIEVTHAVVVLNPTKDSVVQGRVEFKKVDGGVLITGEVSGLAPGKHGFHIHEFGDCSSADGSSAGGHFNPTHSKHGGPDHADRHAGDLGNIVANEFGVGVYSRVDTMIQLNGPNTIVGHSLIVHSLPDDYTTQPTGNAGGRLACGVIVAR